MNSIERVFSAVSGKMPDRLPVACTASLYGAALLHCSVEEYYRRPELYAEGQLLVAKYCHSDIILSPFAFPLFAEACGAKIAFAPKSVPVIKTPLDYKPGDKMRFDIEKLLHHPASEYLLESLRLVSNAMGKEKVIAAIHISPCDLPAMVFGIEKWLHTLLFFPEEAINILRCLGDYFVEMSRRMYQLGAHLMVIPVNFTNPQIVTSAISGYILPEIERIFTRAEGAKVIHHGGPDMESVVDKYLAFSGNLGFVISPKDKIARIREKIGNRTILGNIDGPFLLKHTSDSVKQRCSKILEENNGHPSFVLCTSNADISWDTPIENIQAIVQAAEEYSFTFNNH